MTYDMKCGWLIPALGETFDVTGGDEGATLALRCVEPAKPRSCDGCFFVDNICRGESVNMTALVCLAGQRPDGKDVVFAKE